MDHLGIDISLPATLVLSQINPVHATTFHFLESFLILLSIYNCDFRRWLFPWSHSTENIYAVWCLPNLLQAQLNPLFDLDHDKYF